MIRRSRLRGGSVLEFVVAAALILVIITSASVTMATVQRSVAKDRARDAVTTLASGVLEQAALFDCQLLIEPSNAATEAAAGRNALEPSPCTKMMYPDAASAADLPIEGDMVFTRLRSGCNTDCETTVVVTSRWLPTGEDGYRCRADGSSAGAPVLLERRAVLTWTPSGATTPLVNEYVSVEAVPRSAGFTDPTRSSVVVPALPGEAVLLKDSSGAGLLRIAMPCTSPTGASAEAWFPFLDTSTSYQAVRTGICVPVDGGVDAALGCSKVDPGVQAGPLAALYRGDVTGVSRWSPQRSLLENCPMSSGVLVFNQSGCRGGGDQ